MLLNDFIKYKMHIKKNENTRSAYYLDLSQWLKFQFNKLDVTAQELEDVQMSDIINYTDELSGRAESTKARKTSSIKAFYNYLISQKHVKESPLEHLPQPKLPERDPIFLTADECRELVDSIDTVSRSNKIRNRAIIVLLINTGVRVSELVGLKLKDIKLKEKKISVIGKRDKQRTIPITNSCIKVLEEYLESKDIQYNDYVFTNTHKKPMTRHGVWEMVKIHCKAIGRPEVSPHKLRHTYATALVNSRAPLKQIQRNLGHTDIRTTDMYTHTYESTMHDVVENSPLSDIY